MGVITMFNIFRIISSVLSIYSILCLVRVLLTWFPKANYSQAGRTLSGLCDPYLNIFRKFSFLHLGGLDFSPAAAIIVLNIAGQLCITLGMSGHLSIGLLLSSLIQLFWALASSILNFIIVLLLIRLIAFMYMRYKAKKTGYSSYSPIWDQLDRWISPFIYKISGKLFRRMISFTHALIISIVALFLSVQVLRILTGIVCYYLSRLPF